MKPSVKAFLEASPPARIVRSRAGRFAVEIFELEAAGASIAQIVEFLAANKVKLTKEAVRGYMHRNRHLHAEQSADQSVAAQSVTDPATPIAAEAVTTPTKKDAEVATGAVNVGANVVTKKQTLKDFSANVPASGAANDLLLSQLKK